MSNNTDLWKGISESSKKYFAIIEVDGEVIEDIVYAFSIEEAKRLFKIDWTPPLYESKYMRILSIYEVE